jgi:hypothetical protein
MELIIKIIGLACLGVLWINAEPIIKLKRWIYRSIYSCSRFDHKWHWKLITCCMCSSFWIGLVVTGDLIVASIVSVLGELICRQLNSGRL